MKTQTTKRAKTTTASPVPLRIKSILVPLDFSPSSKKALDYAVTVARQFKAKLTLLHVVEPVATPDFAAFFPLVMEDDKSMNVCDRRYRTGSAMTTPIAERVVREAACVVLAMREPRYEPNARTTIAPA